MPTPFKITRQNVLVVSFFVLLIGLLSLLFTLLEPFLRSFVWATILAMVFYPVYAWMCRRTGGHTNMAALLTTLLVLGFLMLPGFFVVINLGKELPKAYNFLSTAQWDQISQWTLEKMKSFHLGTWLEPWGIDSTQADSILQKQMATALQNVSNLILEKLTHVFRNIAVFLMEAGFISVALFFFFRDGSRLAIKTIELLPLRGKYRAKVVDTFSVTVTAVMRAIFLSALAQGFLATMGFIAVGMPVPILLGLIAFVNSFIPFLGAASVWIPSALWLFYIQDQPLAASGLVAWGIVISVLDHILRPWLIGSEAKLPIFWLFFTTIGGLKVYGFLGIFLGPIILSLGMAFLAIYRELYVNRKGSPASR